MKVNALTLAEMQAVLQSKKDEYDAAEQGIKSLSDKIERYNCVILSVPLSSVLILGNRCI